VRHPLWFRFLCEEIIAHADTPFRWGEHDCCTFAALCIDVMTGSEYLDALQQEYFDEKSAQRFIWESGGLVKAISLFLGEQSDTSRTGDCVVFEQRGTPKCGIVFGPLIVAAAEDGLAFCLRRNIRARWSV
jgi:hypothetical protein